MGASSPASAPPVHSKAPAIQAMGSPRTIQYSGTGVNGFFGQALLAGREIISVEGVAPESKVQSLKSKI